VKARQHQDPANVRRSLNRYNKCHLLILDDLAYVRKDQAETSVLFELIAARVAAKRASGTTSAARC